MIIKSKRSLSSKWFTTALLGLIAYSSSVSSYAAPFEIAVAPSRLELTAKSATRLGQSLQLQNVGKQASKLNIHTLDWTFSAQGDIQYYEELLPNSCRPWVTLERNNLVIPPQGKRSLRFQIDVPANPNMTECRFMVAIEGAEPSHRTALDANGANLNIPVSGRIAVAVYLSLNGAQPQLVLQQLAVKSVQGQRVPVVTVQNKGNAHGRLEGSLNATDASGRAYELIVESTPILPNQTRQLPLAPKAVGTAPASPPKYPIKGKGQLDWAKGSFKLNAEFK